MVISKEAVIGFWLGVALMSLINIILIVINRNEYTFDGYVFVLSMLVLLFFLSVKIHLLKPRHRR